MSAQPNAAASVSAETLQPTKIALAVGQKWRTRGGREVTLERRVSEHEAGAASYAFWGRHESNGINLTDTWTSDGRFDVLRGRDETCGLDLVELIEDAPAPNTPDDFHVEIAQPEALKPGDKITVTLPDGDERVVLDVQRVSPPGMPAIEVGQLWRDAHGDDVRIVSNDELDWPWEGHNGLHYADDGHWCGADCGDYKDGALVLLLRTASGAPYARPSESGEMFAVDVTAAAELPATVSDYAATDARPLTEDDLAGLGDPDAASERDSVEDWAVTPVVRLCIASDKLDALIAARGYSATKKVAPELITTAIGYADALIAATRGDA